MQKLRAYCIKQEGLSTDVFSPVCHELGRQAVDGSKLADQVRDIIRTVRPQHVVVELCEARRRRLEACEG